MGRARGANAAMRAAFEASYGAPPTTGWLTMPFVSIDLGPERGLIESDLLGQGRAPFDPTPDVVTNDGDVVVPVDDRMFGHWLKLLLGAPATVAQAGGMFQHLFDSGAVVLPSMSLDIAMPDVPNYQTNYGARANTMQINAQRSGMLNATFGLIAKGGTVPIATSTISPAPPVAVSRLAQASGSIIIDGAVVGSIVSASVSFSNGMTKVETIRPDGEIEDVDPAMPMATGSVTVVYANRDLAVKASGNIPVSLQVRWTIPGTGKFLTLQMFRVFLPSRKSPITGPGGIMVEYQYQASTPVGLPLFRAELINAVASYA